MCKSVNFHTPVAIFWNENMLLNVVGSDIVCIDTFSRLKDLTTRRVEDCCCTAQCVLLNTSHGVDDILRSIRYYTFIFACLT